MRAEPRDSLILALLGVTLALTIVSWPLVSPGVALITDDGFVSDATMAGIPFRAVFHEAVRGRASLLWCPGIYCGFPLHAVPEAGFFYPVTWLLALLPDPITATHAALYLHLVLAAAGLLVLARDEHLRSGPAASSYGALSFAAGGFLLAHLKHVAMVQTAAWLPWLLAGVARLVEGRGERRGFLMTAMAMAGMGLGGHPQLAYIGLLAAGAFPLLHALVGGDVEGREGRESGPDPGSRLTRRLRPAALLLLALTAGSLAASVQFLPAARLASTSARAVERGTDFAERIPLEPRNLLTWVHARAVGMAGEGTYSGPGLHWEDYRYQGLATVPLAILGFLTGLRRRRLRVWMAMAVLAVLLALGQRALLFGIAHRLLPGMEWFRFPARFLVVAELAAALLAAHGLSALAGWAEGRRRGLGRILPAVAVVALVFDLKWAQQPLNGFAPKERWLAPPATVAEVPPPGRYLSLGAREAHVFAFEHARGWADPEPLIIQRRFLQPSLNLHFGPRSADGYANPVPLSISRLWGDHYRPGLLQRSFMVRDGQVAFSPLFFSLARLAEVRTVLSLWPLSDPRFVPLPARPPVFAYSLPDPLPHVRYVPVGIEVSSLEEAAESFLSPTFDPERETVILSAGGPPDDARSRGRGGIEAVEVLMRTDSELVCTFEAQGPGYLRIAESFDPGWRAWVDGRPSRVLCADLGFQAVAVDRAGRHEVRLEFRPFALTAGLAASALGVLAILIVATRLRRDSET